MKGDVRNLEGAKAQDGRLEGMRTLLVNGEPRQVQADSLAALIEELGMPAEAVATAVNAAFVGRLQRAGLRLADGDSVTVFRPVVGG